MVGKEIGSKEVRIEPQVSTTFMGTLVESSHMIVIQVLRRKKDGQIYGGRRYLRRDDSPSARRVRRAMLLRSMKGLR